MHTGITQWEIWTRKNNNLQSMRTQQNETRNSTWSFAISWKWNIFIHYWGWAWPNFVSVKAGWLGRIPCLHRLVERHLKTWCLLSRWWTTLTTKVCALEYVMPWEKWSEVKADRYFRLDCMYNCKLHHTIL
jgi:hypothetical protein